MYVRMYKCVEYSAFCISKTNKDRNTKFYAEYWINVCKIFLGFGENRKTISGVGRTRRETRSKNLENDFNDFLQLDT